MSEKLIDSLAYLTSFKAAAENMATSAESYLDLMRTEPRTAPVVGGFFITFNGSLVHVSRRRRPCACPVCSAVNNPGTILQIGGVQFMHVVPVGDPAVAGHEEAKEFICTILRGGHGVSGLVGSQPGENYTIGADGLAPLPEISNADAQLTCGMLGLASMSLRRPAAFSVQNGVATWQ